METRNCTGCNGTGIYINKGFTSVEGKVYPERQGVCTGCWGAKTFETPDYEVLKGMCLATRGKNKGTLRASPPAESTSKNTVERRAYYLWRLARFHGGKDMTMPMMAELFTRNDPFKAELNEMSDRLAKECFGTDKAAARRWGQALGYF